MSVSCGVGRNGVLMVCLPFLAACVSLDYVLPKTAGAKVSELPVAVISENQSVAESDGVPDWTDLCSDLVDPILVDAEGCEIVTGVIEGVEFAPDDVKLSSDAKAALDKYIRVFLRYPNVILGVASHTDNRGSAADNLELSKQRLNAVVTYMVTEGLQAKRIRPFAFGESRPIAPNSTLEGREINRRIEIKVIERLL